MKQKIQIGIADDHEIVVDGFVELLKRTADFEIKFTACNGRELLHQIQLSPPDIILLDLEMPVMSGEEAFKQIRKQFPKVKVIIISASFSPAIILRLVKKGVCSFLHKNCSLVELVETIHGVYKQGKYFNPKVAEILAKEVSSPTPAEVDINFELDELDVLKLLCEGLTIKEIAVKLNMKMRAAEWLKSQMMSKIRTQKLSVLIVYAVKHNLV